VGENPLAADTAGVNVDSIRYCCLVVGGATGGLAGAYLSIVNLGIFMDNMTALRGFIAIVIVIFANWRPYGAVVGSLLFGFSDALQSRLQLIFPNIPWQFFVMLPYIVTICMLVISVKRGKAEIPNALLKPYKKE
jgi:simple sugar transport system permease protein